MCPPPPRVCSGSSPCWYVVPCVHGTPPRCRPHTPTPRSGSISLGCACASRHGARVGARSAGRHRRRFLWFPLPSPPHVQPSWYELFRPRCNSTSYYNRDLAACSLCTLCGPGEAEKSPCGESEDRVCKGASLSSPPPPPPLLHVLPPTGGVPASTPGIMLMCARTVLVLAPSRRHLLPVDASPWSRCVLRVSP